ncbi:hypothetical protein BJ508DRAFT_315704 [Ascobolus immersus RN42]|uniref:DUF676 domain-containing protein n=1 Tax=Ascobolus immersus RN42 TaxID=1160509 RepID=A0A3N4HEE0_ASCIM|nr:hypothetical protein BJ508DRAFT_315704 [Ascobolus immersus RN42]
MEPTENQSSILTTCPDVDADGITVLVDPAEPKLDIVFIHGFTGHPYHTWVHNGMPPSRTDTAESSSKFKLPWFNKNDGQSSTTAPKSDAVFWPYDLLPITVPNARVMTFGYGNHIGNFITPANTRSVYDIATDLLTALETYRRPHTLQKLPILFVAHSLGGIIVKDLLRQSYDHKDSEIPNQEHLAEICKSCIGALFFGTPHQGAEPLTLALKVLKSILTVVGPFSINQKVLDILLRDSSELRRLNDWFPIKADALKWAIHSFQETVPLRRLGSSSKLVYSSTFLAVMWMNTPPSARTRVV